MPCIPGAVTCLVALLPGCGLDVATVNGREVCCLLAPLFALVRDLALGIIATQLMWSSGITMLFRLAMG
jgi:hypothetical protein